MGFMLTSLSSRDVVFYLFLLLIRVKDLGHGGTRAVSLVGVVLHLSRERLRAGLRRLQQAIVREHIDVAQGHSGGMVRYIHV